MGPSRIHQQWDGDHDDILEVGQNLASGERDVNLQNGDIFTAELAPTRRKRDDQGVIEGVENERSPSTNISALYWDAWSSLPWWLLPLSWSFIILQDQVADPSPSPKAPFTPPQVNRNVTEAATVAPQTMAPTKSPDEGNLELDHCRFFLLSGDQAKVPTKETTLAGPQFLKLSSIGRI